MLAPLSGYKTYIAAGLAILGALAGALDGDMTWQQAAAVIVPAIVGAAVRHGISTSAAALLQSVLEAAAKIADQAGKKAPALLLALIVGGSLAACTPTQLQQAQSDISNGIWAACTDVMAAEKLNPKSPSAAWAVGACGTATAVGALVQNSATIQWLGQIQQQLAAPPTRSL